MDLVSIGLFALGALAGSVIVGCVVLCFSAWDAHKSAKRWTDKEDEIDISSIADNIGRGLVGPADIESSEINTEPLHIWGRP
jgi:hypothetical protein